MLGFIWNSFLFSALSNHFALLSKRFVYVIHFILRGYLHNKTKLFNIQEQPHYFVTYFDSVYKYRQAQSKVPCLLLISEMHRYF